MRKKLVSAIDGIRNNLHNMRNEAGSTEELELDYELAMDEKILPQHCNLSQIVRHGFPDDPRCMAYDCIQRLIAIGAGRGSVRLFGQAGVDIHLKHDSNEPVIFVQFLINEGGLVTVLRDDTIHLWNYRQTTPKIVNSLKMAKEKVTCIYLPFQSKWLYIGTDKGNVYFISLATFELSTYVINWNKAIDISCRTHPGAVRQFSLCPTDSSRLLIVFEVGCVIVWNLQTKESERFAVDQSPTKCVSWHSDGRQFMCGHKDGSLTIWNLKKSELIHRMTPHSQNDTIECRSITHLHWSSNSDGDQMILFTGGMSEDEGVLPALSVLRGKGSITVLELDHAIVELCPLNVSPYSAIAQYPFGVAVLLKSDLITVDLLSQGYPCFDCPYPIDIHESPVTFISYYADCPVDFIAALTLVGRNQRKQSSRLSERPWPLTGGIGRECATGYQEMLLTGHEDGSIKFWQASSENLEIMYKLKTGRHFERVVSPNSIPNTNALENSSQAISSSHGDTTTTNNNITTTSGTDSTSQSTTLTNSFLSNTTPNKTTPSYNMPYISHAVVNVELCVDSRLLLVAGASGQVTLFRFVKTESCQEIAVVILPQLCFTFGVPTTPTLSLNAAGDEDLLSTSVSSNSYLKPQRGNSTISQRELKRQNDTTTALSSRDSHSTDTSCGSQTADQIPLKVRGGAVRRPTGYQPELVCQIPWINGQTPERITALALNSAFGILAIGTASGVALVDIVTSTPVYAWANAELHGRDSIPYGTCSHTSGASTLSGVSFDSQTMHQTLTVVPSPTTSTLMPLSPRTNVNNIDFQTAPNNSGNAAKSFVRLNTDNKSRSIDRQRPTLSKAQSMATPSCITNMPTAQTHLNQKSGAEQQIVCSPQYDSRLTECNGDLSIGSCSSSLNSLELNNETINNNCELNQQNEFVTSLTFINSYSKKGSSKAEPSLWLGMSTGVCVAFHLILPTDRIISNVFVAPSGSVIRLKDRLLYTTFLNRDFRLTTGPSEMFKDANKDSAPSSGNTEKMFQNKVLTKISLSPKMLNSPDNLSNVNCSPEEFSQLGVFVSEFEIRIISLPGYTQFFYYRPEVPFVKAQSSHIRGYPVLICLNAASQVVVLSLPSLRLLSQSILFRGSIEIDNDICQKVNFSEHGLGMFAASPSEIQKFTVDSELAAQVAECSGELFIPCDMPEPPKTSFLRGVSTLFGGGSQRENIDLDAIFSEKSTNSVASVKSVAKQIQSNIGLSNPPQLSNLDNTNSRSLTAGQAANMAIQNLNERGERLNAVVDATENLRNNAMNFQSRSSKLVEKYEKKKWL